MARRFFACLLFAAVMLGAFCATAAADETDSWYEYSEAMAGSGATWSFPDVDVGEWFYDDVMALATSGVIGGFPDGTFRPGGTVTTGQALKMVLLAVGYAEPAPVASHWARGYLDLALEEGILQRGEITDLDVSISRQLLATVAARAMQAERTSEWYSFSDAQNDDVQALADCGIIGGYTDGTFRPNNSLTRAELSAIVHRILTHRQLNGAEADAGQIELRTTEAGVEFIKAREGFTATAYWDYSQYSIGYGTRCEKNEYPGGITTEQADVLLRLKLQQIEATLDAFLEQNGVELNDSQYDALVSFTYNVGATWMNPSYRLSSLLAEGDYTDNELACAVGIWCHVTIDGKAVIHNSLINRRMLELKLFLYGDYTSKDSPDFCYLIHMTDKGSVEVDVAMYEKGSFYDPLFDASCDGDVFVGWATEYGDTITPDTVVTENMTVYALWQSENPDMDAPVYDDGDEGWRGGWYDGEDGGND